MTLKFNTLQGAKITAMSENWREAVIVKRLQ